MSHSHNIRRSRSRSTRLTTTSSGSELDFDVVYVSGAQAGEPADPERAAAALADGDGWITERNCHYPQKLILKLQSKCMLTKIQILVHNIFVPRKIVISACTRIPECKEDFDILGAAKFDENGSTDFNSRELKTILLEEKVLFVKFVVHKNYPNHKNNPHNQVGVMDIDLFGVRLHNEQAVDWRPTTVARGRLITQAQRRRIGSAPETADGGEGKGAKEACKSLKKLIAKAEDKVKRADGPGEKENLAVVLRTLNKAHTQCVALAAQGSEALSLSDRQFAAACDREAGRLLAAAVDDQRVKAALEQHKGRKEKGQRDEGGAAKGKRRGTPTERAHRSK